MEEKIEAQEDGIRPNVDRPVNFQTNINIRIDRETIDAMEDFLIDQGFSLNRVLSKSDLVRKSIAFYIAYHIK